MNLPRKLNPKALFCAVFLYVDVALAQTNVPATFTSFTDALPALRGLQMSETVRPTTSRDWTAAMWPYWIQKHDGDIRRRLIRGEEDTLTDFVRFGLSFTKQATISNSELMQYDSSSMVRTIAERRVDDLVSAMVSPGNNERVAQLRVFVESNGFVLQSSESTDKLKAYLLTNLLRMRDEFAQYLHQPQDANPFEIFKDRGISLDTNLWPDFLIDEHLQHMMEAGLLKPGSIKRVAIIGPGLDFSNKEGGGDYYPPQTSQPFVVIDSLLRLGLSDSKVLEAVS